MPAYMKKKQLSHPGIVRWLAYTGQDLANQMPICFLEHLSRITYRTGGGSLCDFGLYTAYIHVLINRNKRLPDKASNQLI